MPSEPKRRFDEFYALRVDSSGRPRGARFAKLQDKTASAAIDMKCCVLILQPRSVSRLAMRLRIGRLFRGKLVMPRIRQVLYDEILKAALLAEKRLEARMKVGAVQQSARIKQMIDEADAVLAELRNRRGPARSC
jgi:hypothetical protein